MDTRFWGPSGWKLLHSITFGNQNNGKDVCAFFNYLPYVLPCKFCRASLSEYILEDPIEKSCGTPETLQRWLWRIHNKVNEKLRRQHVQVDGPNPPFYAVSAFYKDKLRQGCSKTHFDGWDFLFSVAECHPLSQASRSSLPILGHPPVEELTTPLEKNRWNLLEPEERLVYYTKFFQSLPAVLPFKEWRNVWAQSDCETYTKRKETIDCLWKIRRTLEKELELLDKDTYASMCKTLQDNRSGCNRSSKSKTCRKKRTKVTTN